MYNWAESTLRYYQLKTLFISIYQSVIKIPSTAGGGVSQYQVVTYPGQNTQVVQQNRGRIVSGGNQQPTQEHVISLWVIVYEYSIIMTLLKQLVQIQQPGGNNQQSRNIILQPAAVGNIAQVFTTADGNIILNQGGRSDGGQQFQFQTGSKIYIQQQSNQGNIITNVSSHLDLSRLDSRLEKSRLEWVTVTRRDVQNYIQQNHSQGILHTTGGQLFQVRQAANTNPGPTRVVRLNPGQNTSGGVMLSRQNQNVLINKPIQPIQQTTTVTNTIQYHSNSSNWFRNWLIKFNYSRRPCHSRPRPHCRLLKM